MDVVMEIETEPRSSLERALMERDREGQLYLETRRQRALVDLLDINRTSFLSTITPPSTNPPSAASSLFQEPLTTPTPIDATATARPSIPNAPIQSDERSSAAAAAASAINTPPSNTPLTTAAIQNIIPTVKKKTRRKSSPGRGRTLVPDLENRPVVSISTSSLEYQLTANLLKFHHVPASSSGTRSRSRSRSKPRPHKPRHATLSNDVKIDTNALTMTSRGTGHTRAKETTQEQEKPDDWDERTGASTSVAKPSPAWNSIPSSPMSMFDPSSPPSISSSEQHYSVSAPLNTLRPASPPLPPLPPKSPRSLIAHYFPGSLPPPPARCRPLHVQKNHVLAPRPFKTPTFGPVFTRPIGAAAAAPPMPSPSSSFQYVTTLPSPTAMDDCVSFSSPSPSISLGPALSVTSIQQPRVPSDLDLSISNSAHARSHYHPQQQPYQLPLHSNNSNVSGERGGGLASFSSLADSEVLGGARHNNNNNSNNNYNNNNISSTKATLATSSVIPIYPRDLMPIAGANTSGNGSSNNSIHHKSGPQKIKPAVPYVRELISGREDPSPSSNNDPTVAGLPTTTDPNTSRDLELMLEEITGRIYTNRTSTGPWSAPLPSCYLHDLPEGSGMDHLGDEKSLPPIRRERGSRYWVFRTAEGEIVPGPYLFLLGHLCPILWWVGSVYPAIEHPDHRHPQHHHRFHRHNHEKKEQRPQRALNFPRSGKNSIASIGSERRLSGDHDPTMRMSMAAQAEAEDAQDLAENPVVQWLQRQLRAAGVRIASITTTGHYSSPFSTSSSSRQQTTDPEEMATLQVVRISQEDPNRDAELPGAGLAGHMNNNSSWIHVPARLLFPPLSTTGTPHTDAGAAGAVAHAHQVLTTTMPTTVVEDTLDTHGPWSAEDNDAYLFELRMERDRKLLRYELDLSWRRINLIWSLGSFVLALTITAVVLTAT